MRQPRTASSSSAQSHYNNPSATALRILTSAFTFGAAVDGAHGPGDATLGGANDLHGSGDQHWAVPPVPRSEVRRAWAGVPRAPTPDHGTRLARRSPTHRPPSRPGRVSPPRRFSRDRRKRPKYNEKTAVSPKQTRSASTHATGWRRGWDSNPRAGYPTRRFRGAPVTTTSVPLRKSRESLI